MLRPVSKTDDLGAYDKRNWGLTLPSTHDAEHYPPVYNNGSWFLYVGRTGDVPYGARSVDLALFNPVLTSRDQVYLCQP